MAVSSRPGNEGGLVHVAHRAAQLVGHHDQHQRGRDDLRQRAGGGDHAGSELAVVAVAQHHRQRDQAHRNHGSGDHAGGCRQQGADEDHRIGHAAADRPEQLADGVEQVFRHAGAFQDQAHEGEEGNRQQGVVGHDAEDAVRQRLQQFRLQQAQFDADQAEEQAVGSQRKCHRKARQQEDDQRAEHDRREVRNEEWLPCLLIRSVLVDLVGGFDCFDFFFRRDGVLGERAGIQLALQEGHALDEFGNALQEHQQEAEGHQQSWPAIQSGRRRCSTSRRCAPIRNANGMP
jgi:hypothetical protein